MSPPLPTVGAAGAGILGSAIMRRLLDQGFPLKVWNRDPVKLAPLVAAGARAVATPAELADGTAVVITCLTNTAAVEAVVFGPDGLASAAGASAVLLDMSSIDPTATRDLAERLRAANGMAWLDAPISGGAPAALEGRMTVMLGGAADDLERARPVLEALAGRFTLMGPVGAGQTTKLINQTLVGCGFAVLAEATALAQRAGVDAKRIPEALAGGRADSRLLQEYMPKMAIPDFTPEGRNRIMVKDLEMVHALAHQTGTPMPVTGLVAQLLRLLVAQGLGDEDNATFVTLYQDKAGTAD